MTKRSLSLCLIVLVSMPGCGAMVFRRDQAVRLSSDTPDARFGLRAGGTAYAVGESILLDRRKDHTVYASAEGHLEQRIEVTSEVSFWRAAVSVVLNGGHGLFTLFISTVLGCSVDIGAGAWQVLGPDVVHVEFAGRGIADQDSPRTTDGSAGTTRNWPTSSPARSTFCSSCGARAGDTTFCVGCGTRLR